MTNPKFPRRQFLHLAAGAVALPVMLQIARAQAYPARPVRVVVGFAAGGTSGLIFRIVDQWFSERLGQPIVIENKPGAAGNIATQTVIAAPPDGYTLLFVPTASAINATLYERLPFNFLRDVAPVAGLVQMPNLMTVHPSVPATTVAEFIAYAKANPGRISMGSGGNGSPAHVIGEHFKMMTGVNLVHVPYRGGAPALTDLIGGQIQVAFIDMAASIEYIRTSKLRALAVTTATRSEALPDVPAIGDFVPGFEASQWVGLCAPKTTPTEIVDRLNKEVNAALADPKIKARLADLGGTVLPGSPAHFGKLIADDTAKWSKVIRFSGAMPD